MAENSQLNERAEEILRRIEIVLPIFSEVFRNARRNSDFYLGRQWTRQEIASLERQRREPYVWNKLQTYVNNIVGMQIQTRLDYTVQSATPEMEPYSQVMQQLLSWAMRINDIDKIETDIFLHGILHGVSISQVRWKLSDFWGGYPAIERIPVYQMFWDATATDMSLEGASWMARVIPMTERQVELYFDKKAKKVIDSWSSARAYRLPFWGYLTRNQELIYTMAGFASRDTKDRNIYWIIEFYENIPKPVYTVIDSIYNNDAEFDSEAIAKSYCEGLISEYSTIPDINLVDENGFDRVYVATSHKNVIKQTIVAGGEIIEEQDTEMTMFPFQVYTPINVDGSIGTPINALIYPQKFLNRMISEWDNILSRTGRGILTVVESLLPRDWDAARIAKIRSETAATIPVLRHDALQQIPDHTTTPDIPNLINVVQSFMMEAGGGQNILGLQENAAESGKAVRARQAAAGLNRVPLFYNLQQWKKDVSAQVLWFIKNYMAEDQMARILSVSDAQLPDIEWSPETFNTLRSMETDIAVTITTDTETARQETYNQLLQLLSTGLTSALSPQTLLYILVEMNPNLTREVKEKIMQSDEVAKQIMAQLAEQQRQEKLKKQGEEGALRKIARDEALGKIQGDGVPPTL